MKDRIRIAHLADVHWRSLSRHDEYRRAFEKMFIELRALKPDVIALCGDIVHSKTQGITPEVIDQLTWWFNKLAEICPVHMILGNHDGNLMNLQRQDAISPIITALNNPNIHLYKKSGTYRFAPGFNWCAFSVFDEEGWKDVKQVPDEINIALFHGSVMGSMTDQGWELDSEMGLEFFKNFDFALLGDIHMRQFLAYRDNDHTKPWIAYCGSTIMQSYGETPGKGFLLWDIKDRNDFNVTFHAVEHDREFHTLDWQGTLRTTLDEAKKFPRGSRIRVKSDTLIPQVEVKQLSTELLALQGASEVVFKDDYVIDAKKIDKSIMAIERPDFRSTESIFKLFKEYFSEGTFTEKEWSDIRSLIEKYINRALAEDQAARNARWSLKELKFSNTFGYGKDNCINFRKLNGITGIFGPNRAGKSSIIGTLLYALFNGTDRGSLKNLHIVNSRKGHCNVRLTVTVDGHDYCLERQTVKHEARGVAHAITNLNFIEVDENGELIRDLNGEQRTDTEKVIRGLLGTGDDCMLTAIAAQGEMNRFIDGGAAFRDQVISRFLDLVVFEKMSNYAKEDSGAIKAEVKNAPDKDWDTLLGTRADEYQKTASEILRIEKILREKRSTLHDLKVELATSYAGDIITQSDVERERKKIDQLRSKLEFTRAEQRQLVARLKLENEELIKIQAELSSIPVVELKEKLVLAASLKDTLSALKQQHEKEKQIFNNQEKSVARLNDVPCGDSFPSCKYIRDSHEDKKKLKEQQEKISELWKQVEIKNDALAQSDVTKIDQLLDRHSWLLKEESRVNLSIVKGGQLQDSLDRSVVDIEKLLVDSEMRLADFISRVVEDDGSVSLKASIADLEAVIEDLDSNRVKFASRKGALGTEMLRLRDERERFKLLKTQWRMYEMFIGATSKKGIPAQIVQSQLPIINAEISRILHGVVDYTLRFEKDIDSNTTEIYIDYGDSARLIELASGMEKMIASLAIRVALQNASVLSRPDFLIIDEGFGTLDETNVEACNRLLVSLKRWFRNIIIISHIDGVKDVADNIIEVTRDGKDSYVRLD